MNQRIALTAFTAFALLVAGCNETKEGPHQPSAIVPAGAATVVATGTSIQVGGAPKVAAPAGAPPAASGKPDDGGW